MRYGIGDVVSGFRVMDVRDVPDYKGTGYLLRHGKTGFEVFFIENSDRECFFSYLVYTPPANSRGIFHIIEHTVLTGSERYPVKDPFMAMVKNSPNTFLNALTSVDRTYYPAASMVEKDLDNIFLVYTDAVFSPLLRKESFEQEGIRISSEGGLHFEGVVFSEMLGDMSQHESVLNSAMTRGLFAEDSPYRYESGGDAREICRLTYGEFLSAFRKYYVPENMVLFLYGDMDIEEKLSILDSQYLSGRDGGKKAERVGLTERWDKPRRIRLSSNAEDGQDSSSVVVSWLLGDNSSRLESTILSLIVDMLLGSPGCPLYKAISDSDLGESLSSESGMSNEFRELSFGVGFSGADERNAERIESFILSVLSGIVRDGLDKKAIEASIRRMEFSTLEIPGGIPQGMRAMFKVEKCWLYGKDPYTMLDTKRMIRDIRKLWEDDPLFFEHWIEKNLINNSHRLLTVVAMDADNSRRVEEEISKALDERKAEYSQDEEKAFEAFQEEDDDEDAVSRLPSIGLEDLPNRIDTIGHVAEGSVVRCPILTGGVVYTDIIFDISDFDYRELDAMNLYSRLMNMCDVGDMDYSEFSTALRFVSGGYAFYIESGADINGNEKVYLVCRLKSLPGLERSGLDLFLRLFEEGKLDNRERIKAALLDIITDFQSGVIQNGHTFALSAAQSILSPSLYIGERLFGVSYWYTAKDMLEDLDGIAGLLADVKKKAICSRRAMIHVAAEDDDMEQAVSAAEYFMSRLPEGDGCGSAMHELPSLESLQAYTLSSSVSYIGLAGRSGSYMDRDASADKLLSIHMTSSSLWSEIRGNGGAYGAGAFVDPIERTWSFYSYRDPRLDATISGFSKALRDETIDSTALVNAKLRVLSQDVRSVSPSSRALIDIRRIVFAFSDDLRQRNRDLLLSLTVEDLESSRARFLRRLDEGEYSLAVISDRSAVSGSAHPFVSKSLPF